MAHALPVPSLRWRSYWRRAPLLLQARLGDREAEGLAEVLAFLRNRPAAAIAIAGAAPEATAAVQAACREAGLGTLRLRADDRAQRGRHVLFVLAIGAPGSEVATIEALLRRLPGAPAPAWCLIAAGEDAAARLQALAWRVLHGTPGGA